MTLSDVHRFGPPSYPSLFGNAARPDTLRFSLYQGKVMLTVGLKRLTSPSCIASIINWPSPAIIQSGNTVAMGCQGFTVKARWIF